MKIKLSISEMHIAAQIGSMRQIQALAKGLPDRHGFDGLDGWSVHIEGAAGEMAVAKALNLYWGGSVNTFKSLGDIGSQLEVRTRSKDYYELIIRPNDKDDSRYVLVTGRAPNYNVVGWIKGKDAKQEKWSKTHGNRPAAFFVPHKELNDIGTI